MLAHPPQPCNTPNRAILYLTGDRPRGTVPFRVRRPGVIPERSPRCHPDRSQGTLPCLAALQGLASLPCGTRRAP